MKLGFLVFLIMILSSCSHSSSLNSKVVVAHRGASGYLPEHSLLGVAMAHSWDVDYIEADVVLTKDNKPVVLHDIHLDTTTNVAKLFASKRRKDGRFYAIDLTLNEIKRLSLNERIDLKTNRSVFPKRYAGKNIDMKVPTLEEFLELVQALNRSSNKDIGVYVEIKSPEFHKKSKKDISKITLEVLREYGYDKENSRAIIQCFFPDTLKRLKVEFKTKIPLVFLIADNSWNESSVDYNYYMSQEGLTELRPYIMGIGPWINQLKDDGLSRRAKSLNYKIHAYTHRTDALFEGFSSDQLLEFLFRERGVDGIFSDFGDQVVAYLKDREL